MKKNLFLVTMIGTGMSASVLATSTNHVVSAMQAIETASTNIASFNIQSMTGKQEIYVRNLKSKFINDQQALELNYSPYANSWTDFVQKYPNFKFTNLTLQTGLQNDKKQLNLKSVIFKTANFKEKANRTGLYRIDSIKSIHVTDYVELAVVAQLFEEEKCIYFGVQYDLNISNEYPSPYPFYDSVTDKIQFIAIAANKN